MDDAGADDATDGVVGRISQDGRNDEQEGDAGQVERAARAQGARGKEQRVARQERRHHQSGFREDDQEQDGVDPDPVARDELEQVNVHM